MTHPLSQSYHFHPSLCPTRAWGLLKLLALVLLAGTSACSLYFTVPLQTYLIAKGPDVGAPALPYFAYADTTLEIIDREFRNAGASVTIEKD